MLKQVIKIRLLQAVDFLQGDNQGGHFQSQCPAHGQPLTVAGADQTGNAGGDAVYVVVIVLGTVHTVEIHQTGNGVKHGAAALKARFQNAAHGMKRGKNRSQNFHQTGRI